jgi:hypothetical protein
MYWLWFFIFAGQPAFWLLGYFDLLGSEAKKAADDILPIYAIAGGLVMVGFVGFLVLRAFGVV